MIYSYKEDGITHINIYSKGHTELGRILSNFALTPFQHPEDGKFASVEGYWYWLSCKDDKLRRLYGASAKKYGRSVGGADWLDSYEFKRKIELAILTKIQQTPKLELKLAESTLPLTHYYVFNNRVIEPKEGKWVIDYIISLRNFLHNVK